MEDKSVEQSDIIIKCSLEEMTKAFFKDYEIIWHDPNVNSQENQQHLRQLEKLCKVRTFTEWKEAEDYIKAAKTVCHLITSGTNGELLVKEIFSSENVPKILTFCRAKDYHSTWTKNYEKILCTETKIEDVICQIKKNLLEWQKQASSLKFDLPAFAPIFDDSDKSDMNHLHHYLKVIPNFHHRAQAKKDFVDLSERVYTDEENSKLITRFEQTYKKYDMEAILKWYTRQSFLYKVINNCLRVATSDSIQYCRFLLKDVESAIRDQYQVKSKNFSGLLYRGAYLSEEEWSSLKTNIRREIEMHGFLSVSKDSKIALNFVKGDPSKKVFITIIVPKGPNEEDQGFAEVEEFSDFPNEKEVLFNVRSRFTVLETEEKQLKGSPFRHLILFYGAQSLRRYVTETNPVQEISIKDVGNISCSGCRVPIVEIAEKMFFISLEKQIYSCRKCIENTAAPFICVPITENKSKIKIKGCLLPNASQQQIPFYGYKCSKCGAKNQKRYFVCTDCSESGRKWCQSCFEKKLDCIETGHTVILETYPFSFWSEKMSDKELNHLNFQNDLVIKGNLEFQQAKMYIETRELEKAIKYCQLILQQNEGKVKNIQLANAYHYIGVAYDNQGGFNSLSLKKNPEKKALEEFFFYYPSLFSKNHDFVQINFKILCPQGVNEALEYHLKSLDTYKSIHGENHQDIANSYNHIGTVYARQGDSEKALEYYFKSLNTYKSVHGETHPDIATCYNNIGFAYNKKAEHQKALEYYQKSRDIDKSIYGEKHPDVACTYVNIGEIEEEQGEYQKALKSYFKALDIYKSIHGEKHHLVSSSYGSIGSVYSKMAEYNKALEYDMKCLEIQKSVHRENHPDIATSYNNIGLIYKEQGQYDKALEYQLKSLDIFKAIYGEKHSGITLIENNIASVYQDQGEYEKALEYHFKSLDIYKSAHGEKHPQVAICYNNIGSIYQEQGEYQKALEYYFKSLDTYKSIYGEKHPDVASFYNNIGIVYNKLAEYNKAIEYYKKSLEIGKSVYEENHPKIAIFYNNIGLVYKEQGEYEKALEYHFKALDIHKSAHGENHHSVATSYTNLGLVYSKMAEYNKALEYYMKSLKIQKSVHKENHPDIAISYNNIGSILKELEQHEGALGCYLKSLEIKKSVYGEKHPDIAISYNNMGSVFQDLGKYDKALEYYFKSFDIYKSVYGENHLETSLSYNNIGLVYKEQGKYDQALTYLFKSLEIEKSAHGENHPETASSYDNIGSVYDRQGECGQALEYYLKSIEIKNSFYGEKHPDIVASYLNIAQMYEKQGEREKVLEYNLKALEVCQSTFGEDHEWTAILREEVASLCENVTGNA